MTAMSPGDIAMLERAAKAAGYIEFTCHEGIGPRARAANGVGGPWNPLDDEGDAEALRIKFGLTTGIISRAGGGPGAIGMHAHLIRGGGAHVWSVYLADAGVNDLAGARRRAIVNAAATMPA